jgi:hypothetical protein
MLMGARRTMLVFVSPVSSREAGLSAGGAGVGIGRERKVKCYRSRDMSLVVMNPALENKMSTRRS